MTQGRVVIVAHDEASTRHIAVRVGSLGYVLQTLLYALDSTHQIVKLSPDAIFLQVRDAADGAGLALCQTLTTTMPQCPIILYGPMATTDLLHKAMAAGARRFLTTPASAEAVAQALTGLTKQMAAREAAQKDVVVRDGTPLVPGAPWPRTGGQIVTIYSPKGGVGCSTMAVNLAIGLQARGKRTVLVDANLGCGNLAVMLGITPTKTILDAAEDDVARNPHLIYASLTTHKRSGIAVLCAPMQPEQAEMITPQHLRAILSTLQMHYDYVIVDTAATYNQTELLVLDMAATRIIPVTPDLAMLKNLRIFVRRSEALGHDTDQMLLVLMRADSVSPEYVSHIEQSIGRRFDHYVVSDGQRATAAINKGTPLVLGQRKSRIAQDLLELIEHLEPKTSNVEAPAQGEDPMPSSLQPDTTQWTAAPRRRFALAPR